MFNKIFAGLAAKVGDANQLMRSAGTTARSVDGAAAPRAALRWSAHDLADRTALSISTIKRAEAEDGIPKSTRANLLALWSALATAGIEFIGTPDDGPGLHIRTPPAQP